AVHCLLFSTAPAAPSRYPLPLHDALPILSAASAARRPPKCLVNVRKLEERFGCRPRTGECTHPCGSHVPIGTVECTTTSSARCRVTAPFTASANPDDQGMHTCSTSARSSVGSTSRRATSTTSVSTSATAVPTWPAPSTRCRMLTLHPA